MAMRCSCFSFWRRRLYAPLDRYQQTPPLARFHKYHEIAQHDGVSFATACCITINLVMGSGFLALPKAFVAAGMVLGTVVLVACMFAIRMTTMYEVEVMCRAEAWVKANMVPIVDKRYKDSPEVEMRISTHAFQVTEMCEIFGGRRLQRLYNFVLFLYMFCALWGFGAVFGDALAAYAPVPFLGDAGAYRMYVCLFALVVVPLSTLNIKEQAIFQIILTGFRFAILVLMVGSVVLALSTGEASFGTEAEDYIGTSPLFRWSGLGTALPAVIFALTLASTSPTIVSALEEKERVGSVIWLAVSLSAVTYGLISLAAAYYFGEDIAASCNVNWASYRPGGPDGNSVLAFLGRLAAYFVVLFPAIDVTSVYPLNVMVLANNMMAAIYNDRVDKAETDTVIVTTFRIACAAPPLLCALVFRNLTYIIDYAGALAIVIAFVFPAYLNLISQRLCYERFGTSKTPFTGMMTSAIPTLVACMAFGTMLFVGLSIGDVVEFFQSR